MFRLVSSQTWDHSHALHVLTKHVLPCMVHVHGLAVFFPPGLAWSMHVPCMIYTCNPSFQNAELAKKSYTESSDVSMKENSSPINVFIHLEFKLLVCFRSNVTQFQLILFFHMIPADTENGNLQLKLNYNI